jgi:hypothetical protein
VTERTFELLHVSPPRLRIYEDGEAVQELTIPGDQARAIGGKLLVLGCLEELEDPSLSYDSEAIAEVVRKIWPKGGADDRKA